MQVRAEAKKAQEVTPNPEQELRQPMAELGQKSKQLGEKTKQPTTPPSLTPAELLARFCKQIKLLSLDMNKRFPNNATVARAHKRICLGTETNPEFVLGVVGPILERYQQQIDARDEKFFLESDYASDFKEATSEEKTEMSKAIMVMLKASWAQLEKKEKEAYFDVVTGLLDDYLDYAVGDSDGDSDGDSAAE